MKTVLVKVKKLEPDARVPSYAHPSDAAFDFYMPKDDVVPPYASGYLVGLGVSIELPAGFYMELHLRSSTALKTPLRLANNVGIIDEGYRGELGLILDSIKDEAVILHKGDRIAQGILRKKVPCILEETSSLTETERGKGGFGSTGT